MPRHEEQKTLAYTADELFSVVADVKDYPSFVPWCAGARIHRESPQEIIAELEIGFWPFKESLTSQATLNRPRQVLVRAVEGGPLEHLTIRGHSRPQATRLMPTSLSTSSSRAVFSIMWPTPCLKRPRHA